ncbi:MAG: NAD(P)H-hydrate dehydratase [Synergistaceae bacterium]|jgi:NAD(P)H-hydrate epimerase|nr:NAD(P)H-hydrate dehydratase [Synergistaceae bacterium]
MKKYYTGSSVREADRAASEKLAVPGIVLMENAGRSAAEALIRRNPYDRNFLILCGPGNNGGDGFVVARHLALWQREPTVLCTNNTDKYKDAAASAAASARNSGVKWFCSRDLSDADLASLLKSAGVVVDALLGTGSDGAPRGEVVRIIGLCPDDLRVVSLDMPSGVDPDTGETYGAALRAEVTLTFLAEKVGLAVSPGCLHSGEVEVCGIGVAPDLVLGAGHALAGYDSSDVQSLRPRIPKDVHKSGRGALMIVGGSDNFRGAPVLAAIGALRAGCGLVFLAVPDFIVPQASSLLPEAIFLPLPSKDGLIRFKSLEKVLSPWFGKCDALVVGPGIGREPETEMVTGWLCKEWRKPILIDADALHHVANIERNANLGHRRESVVITPHEGEAAHLLGTSAKKVACSRLSACVDLAGKFGTALLKGPHTLVCYGSERRVILEGGPQLAIPGSGDVLSGVIGALLASGISCIDAATLGAVLHGASGGALGRADGLLAREIAGRIKLGED